MENGRTYVLSGVDPGFGSGGCRSSPCCRDVCIPHSQCPPGSKCGEGEPSPIAAAFSAAFSVLAESIFCAAQLGWVGVSLKLLYCPRDRESSSGRRRRIGDEGKGDMPVRTQRKGRGISTCFAVLKNVSEAPMA